MLKVASIQLGINDSETKEERLARVTALLDQVSGADLVLLPEIWHLGYFSFDLYDSAGEEISGTTFTTMAAKAREHRMYLLAGSIVEKAEGRLYNTCAMFDPQGTRIATYRKIHLFGYGSFETKLLTPGRDVVAVKTEIGPLGFTTCYALRFPELYRRLVDQGTEIFLVSSAWPYPRLEHWQMLNRVRALENEGFLISANCAGTNRGKQFLGHSMVVDPWGTVVAGAGDGEVIIRTEIDVALAERVRKEFPPLQDRVLKN